MPRFSGGAFNQAPLQIQVKATASGAGSYLTVFGIKAEGETATGSASRPILYRPGTAGTGTPQTPQVRGANPSAVSSAELLTSFTSAPSTPSVTSGTFNLPIRVSWMTKPSLGVVAARGGALCLYQNASGGYTVSGSIFFEEL